MNDKKSPLSSRQFLLLLYEKLLYESQRFHSFSLRSVCSVVGILQPKQSTALIVRLARLMMEKLGNIAGSVDTVSKETGSTAMDVRSATVRYVFRQAVEVLDAS